jgi:hypothetical protein
MMDLRVVVINAINVPKLGLVSSADTYVVLRLASDTREQFTKVAEETLNPVWNQEFRFSVRDYRTDVLHVYLKDRDTCDHRTSIARVLLPLGRFPVNQSVHQNYAFEPLIQKPDCGVISLIIKLVPGPSQCQPQPRTSTTPYPSPQPFYANNQHSNQSPNCYPSPNTVPQSPVALPQLQNPPHFCNGFPRQFIQPIPPIYNQHPPNYQPYLCRAPPPPGAYSSYVPQSNTFPPQQQQQWHNPWQGYPQQTQPQRQQQ